MKRVLILGGDGYLGWPTAMHFSRAGYDVAVVDNMAKRNWEADVGSMPLWPVPPIQRRIRIWEKVTGKKMQLFVCDVAENDRYLFEIFEQFKPEVIIDYAEQPSAPFSMVSPRKAVYTQFNNVIGTLKVLLAMRRYTPEAHLVKLGTMGEYGTPNIDIEEGWIDISHKGRKDRMLYPKRPGSIYHLTKVHDSHNIEFACRTWGFRSTDLNQGVVYGIETEETELHPELLTSFHYDEYFGTVLNRFCVEAIAGIPLTVYGKGGQQRGFLNIRDTIKCVRIAVENPPEEGEFRVFNQFTEIFSVNQLAEIVKRQSAKLGIEVRISNLPNPRVEKEEHYYNASNESLLKLGLKPIKLSDELINSMLVRVKNSKELIDSAIILPTVPWKRKYPKS